MRSGNVFSPPQQAQGSAEIHNDLRNESEVGDDLESGPIRENADTTIYTREAVEEKDDSELNEIEDRETGNALKWLGAE